MRNTCLSQIKLPSICYVTDRPFDLCCSVELFISIALDEAGYISEELPDNAGDFVHLMKYCGEWNDGGHSGYNGNVDDPESWQRASRLLGEMGLTEYKRTLDDFIEFSMASHERLDELYENGEEAAARRLFDVFDDRFWELRRHDGGLEPHMSRWLLGQPWLVLDPAAPPLTAQTIRESLPPHPLVQERKDAEVRRRTAEDHGANQAFLRRLLGQLSGREKS